MTTARTIIISALQELGVIGAGQTPNGADFAACLDALNVLADSWLTEPNYAYTTSLVSFSLPANTTSRTIGPAMQINCARPVRIENPGSFITVGNLDYPLEVVTIEQYNAITLKTVSGPWPSLCMYDGGAPTGNVYFWPLGACTVKLLLQQPVSRWATLTTDVTLPPGYERAFKFTLVEEVAGTFSRVPTVLQMRHAAGARRVVKRANFSVPQLVIGDPMAGTAGWIRIKAG